MKQTDSARALIEQLELAPHPEGGWYRETWRSDEEASGRAKGTAILFLLTSDQRSHWHRVDADELWFWQSGDPLDLLIADDDAGPVKSITLGRDVTSGQSLQGLVPTGAWQAAEPSPPSEKAAGYTLVSCVVVPGFEFAGFELAAPGWSPGA
ncbi:cupin domain-containing protein [uncultured Erythrobacter sp.]|uniref:cupin domain-containing protein n=1 Tax=uncultured Erythrobacter sp. TaxID=263913 RepID=UPI0026146F0C|nr:cupin domain-containing protein [uncultured Erythrobacter sp.]